jgi:hypothetical protein
MFKVKKYYDDRHPHGRSKNKLNKYFIGKIFTIKKVIRRKKPVEV